MSNCCQNLAKIVKKGQFMQSSLFHRTHIGITHDSFNRYLASKMSTTEFIIFSIYLLGSLCFQSWLRVSVANKYRWPSPSLFSTKYLILEMSVKSTPHTITTAGLLFILWTAAIVSTGFPSTSLTSVKSYHKLPKAALKTESLFFKEKNLKFLKSAF